MKNSFFILFIIYGITGFISNGQTGPPDTVITDLNSSIPNRTWQFSFIHLTDVHIGEGVSGGDYGTAGYDDVLTPSDYGLPAQNLSNTVKWINQNAARLKIKFVAVTGDLTRSGEKSEFMMFKQIADSLIVPYIPLMGNHEMWPYTDNAEAPAPNGDSLINAIFADRFNMLATDFDNWNDGTRLTRTWNSENNCYSYFQNYSFTYGNYLFFFGDFAPRAHAPLGYPGIGPEADIMNFSGGTWQYIQQFVDSYPQRDTENMIFLSHYPLTKDPWALINAFSYGEYDNITKFLLNYSTSASAWVAGHIHRDSEYGVSTWTFSPSIVNGIETNSNKDVTNGHFRIIKVWDNYVDPHLGIEKQVNTSSVRIYPNPGTKNLTICQPDAKVKTRIELFSSTGTKVFSGYIDSINYTIDTGTLTPGVYLIKVGTEHGIDVMKWIKY